MKDVVVLFVYINWCLIACGMTLLMADMKTKEQLRLFDRDWKMQWWWFAGVLAVNLVFWPFWLYLTYAKDPDESG